MDQNSGETLQALWEQLVEEFRNSEKSTRILNIWGFGHFFKFEKFHFFVLLQAMKDVTLRILALSQVWKIPLELLLYRPWKMPQLFPLRLTHRSEQHWTKKCWDALHAFWNYLQMESHKSEKKSNCKCSGAIWNVTTFLARRLLRDPHRGGRMLRWFTCFWKN
jgi:hypothetical protein